MKQALTIESTTTTCGAPLLDEGTYPAVYSGYVVEITLGSATYKLAVNHGIRGRRECMATILGFSCFLHD